MVIVFIAVLSGSITDTFGQLRVNADETDRKIAEYDIVPPPHSSLSSRHQALASRPEAGQGQAQTA